MKRSVLLLLACGMAVAALSVVAAPPVRGDLPANPAWLLHVDCDALRQTFLGKYLLYQMDKPELSSNMAAFRSLFSFDLRTQLHGVTVYNDGVKPADNIVLIYADFDTKRVIGLFKASEAAATATNNHHAIYSWIDKKKNSRGPAGPRNFAAVQGHRLIVGKNRESVAGALAIIDGTAAHLAAGSVLPEIDAAGSALFAEGTGRDLIFLPSDSTMAWLKTARRIRLSACETQDQLNAVVTVETRDESTARQMSVIAQGVIALLSLQADNPDVAKLAGGVSVQRDGATWTATLTRPAMDLIAALKSGAAKNKK